MTTIIINTLENSPELCDVVLQDITWFNLSLAQAIQLRNELMDAINEYQKHFSDEYDSNGGCVGGRI